MFVKCPYIICFVFHIKNEKIGDESCYSRGYRADKCNNEYCHTD